MPEIFPIEDFAALLRRRGAADPAPLHVYAQRCDCSVSQIHQVRAGERRAISLEMFCRLCRGHGLDPVATFTALLSTKP